MPADHTSDGAQTAQEAAEMNRILGKVDAHEIPSSEEIAFLQRLKIEVLEWYTGPSVRVGPPGAAQEELRDGA